MSVQPVPERPARERTAHRVLPPDPKQALIVVAGFTALLYLVELLDTILPADLDQFGIVPRHSSGLDGILFSPLLHSGWGHLIANTLPVVVFSFLAMAGGLGQFAVVTGLIWLVSGVGIWLTGADGVTVGASGLCFGWLLFLLVRGIFTRNLAQLAVGVGLLLYWGTMLFGVLPGRDGISWQAHLFGALGGVLAAWLVATADKRAGSVGA